MVGKIIEHYRILERIGEGGMGIVYRAEDTRLRRIVALKFLHPGLTSDAEAKRRFIREAQAASALQHSNICTVHDIHETAEGHFFICMDYYDGQTLEAIIKHGALPPSEAVRISAQVADGLARAHEAGMAHRDIKPGNIIVTVHGEVKILDFGLAKLAGQTAVTRHGTKMGTVGYMSLEQLRGDATDCRTDVWSLGVVLFEMLTGHTPYRGTFDAEIVYLIASNEIDPVETHLSEVPPALKQVLRKCLEKEPGKRYTSATALAHDLHTLHAALPPAAEAVHAPEPGHRPPAHPPPAPLAHRARTLWRSLSRKARMMSLAGFGVIVSLSTGLLAYHSLFHASAPMYSRFTRLTEIPGQEGYADISPDGSFVVFTMGRYGSGRDIYWQRVGGSNPVNLTPNTAEDNCHPVISPDGTQIAFRSERDGGGVFLMGATGESVRRVTDFGYNPSWSPDGKRIVVATEAIEGPFDRSRESALWVVELASGTRGKLTTEDAVQPSWSPHGQRIAYWGLLTGMKVRDIWTISSQGGVPVRVTDDAYVDWSPTWSPDGLYLIFCSTRGGSMNLWRIPIDEESGEILGDPEPVPAPTGFAAFPHGGRRADRLVYVSDNSRLNIHRVGFDPDREQIRLPELAVTRGSKFAVKPSPSPDGRWVAFRGGRMQEDIYLVSPDGQQVRQLTDDSHRDLGPRWMPDGEHLVFYSNRTGRNQIWQINCDGSNLVQVTDDTTGNVWAPRPFPDGTRLAYMAGSQVKIIDLTIPPERRMPQLLPPPDVGLTFTLNSISPDGRWMAGYQRQGNVPLPGIVLYSLEQGTYRKIIDFGVLPEWLSDSRRLIVQHEGRFCILDCFSGRTRDLGFPEEPLAVGVTFSISPDDRTIYYTHVQWESDIWMAGVE